MHAVKLKGFVLLTFAIMSGRRAKMLARQPDLFSSHLKEA
jgi:hypothetical protein